MWVAVTPEALTGSIEILAGHGPFGSRTAAVEPRRSEAPQKRQQTRPAAQAAVAGQHSDAALLDTSMVSTSTGAGYRRANLPQTARPVDASSKASKLRHDLAASFDQQANSQRQRPRPRQALALAVINDRAAAALESGLNGRSAASEAIPVYERAAAALGGAAPASQPAAGGCTSAQANSVAAGADSLEDVINAEVVRRAARLSAADASLPDQPDQQVQGHLEAAGASGVVAVLGQGRSHAATEAPSAQHPGNESQHGDAQPIADIRADQSSMGDGKAHASAPHAAVMQPETAALSLEAGQGPPIARPLAAEAQLDVYDATAAHPPVLASTSGAASSSRRLDSSAEGAMDVPPHSASLHADGDRRNHVQGIAGFRMQPVLPTAAGHVAAATHGRPKKRRRKAVALGSDAPMTGNP